MKLGIMRAIDGAMEKKSQQAEFLPLIIHDIYDNGSHMM